MLKQFYLFSIIFCSFFSFQTHLFSQQKYNDYYDPSEEILRFYEKQAERLISKMTIEEKPSNQGLKKLEKSA